MAENSVRAIWLAAIAFGLIPLPRPATAQDEAAPAERNLYLECLVQSGERKNHTIAINAERRRAASRPLDGTRGGTSYGVHYETDEIILFPNRLPPGPGYTRLAIDRKTLALTYFQKTNPARPSASWSPPRNAAKLRRCRARCRSNGNPAAETAAPSRAGNPAPSGSS